MPESRLSGMEKKSPETPLPETAIILVPPVALVPSQWMPHVLGVNPDLVGTAGNGSRLNQGRRGKALYALEFRERRLAITSHANHAFTALQHVFFQRRIDPLPGKSPLTGEQRDIDLADLIVPELLMQRFERAAFLGDQQTTVSLPVQPMHQFEMPGVRSQSPQRLDDAMRKSTAPVHGHPGGLVEDQKVVVFENDARLNP